MTVTTQKPHTTLKALPVALIIALIISGFIAIFHTERDALGETAFTIAFILVIIQGPLAELFSYALKGSLARAIFACIISWLMPIIGLALLATYHRNASELQTKAQPT